MTRGGLSASVSRVVRLIGAYLPSRLARRRRDFNCAFQDAATWDERASEAVAMLRAYLSFHEPASKLVVGDFGAGNERLRGVLEHALPYAHEYHPFDLAPQLPTTSRIDLASELPAGPFDVVFCLGVLDYFPRPAELLSRIGSVSQVVVFSYVVVDGAEPLSRRERRARGWLADLSSADMDRELERIGLRTRSIGVTNRDRTRLWLAESSAERPIGGARESGPS